MNGVGRDDHPAPRHFRPDQLGIERLRGARRGPSRCEIVPCRAISICVMVRISSENPSIAASGTPPETRSASMFVLVPISLGITILRDGIVKVVTSAARGFDLSDFLVDQHLRSNRRAAAMAKTRFMSLARIRTAASRPLTRSPPGGATAAWPS